MFVKISKIDCNLDRFSQQVSAAHLSSEVFLCRELMEFFSDVLPLISPNWHLFYWVMFFVCVFVGQACYFLISIFFEGKQVVFSVVAMYSYGIMT